MPLLYAPEIKALKLARMSLYAVQMEVAVDDNGAPLVFRQKEAPVGMGPAVGDAVGLVEG